jgi:hypothetical protein
MHGFTGISNESSAHIVFFGIMAGLTEINYTLHMILAEIAETNGITAIHNESNVALISFQLSYGLTEIDANARIGIIIYDVMHGLSEIVTYIRIAVVDNQEVHGRTYIHSHTDLETVIVIESVIDVTIPPGGELVIDSDLFTAYMNRANVLHHYHGGWIMFERPIIILELQAGTDGEIDGEVVFTERYL